MRIKNELTLRKFSRILGKDPGNISKLERGLLPPPKNAEIIEGYGRAIGLGADSKEIKELKTIAALENGQIPVDVLNDKELMNELPIFFRTATGSKLEREKLKKFIENLRKV